MMQKVSTVLMNRVFFLPAAAVILLVSGCNGQQLGESSPKPQKERHTTSPMSMTPFSFRYLLDSSSVDMGWPATTDSKTTNRSIAIV